ncbi:hypothetical protein CISG_08175 [Coccidioides immitis RMSCC 3703]|uniref:Uncharacterized protein n=1 Tax=Coccidioides immitis RMSCC 3703 TaxID=454286 RepID=A0A0J8R6E5_COCIT|nr:hypothetical protein CISG_08175 [Coccidioides immitis RMSCC 3703]
MLFNRASLINALCQVKGTPQGYCPVSNFESSGTQQYWAIRRVCTVVSAEVRFDHYFSDTYEAHPAAGRTMRHWKIKARSGLLKPSLTLIEEVLSKTNSAHENATRRSVRSI